MKTNEARKCFHLSYKISKNEIFQYCSYDDARTSRFVRSCSCTRPLDIVNRFFVRFFLDLTSLRREQNTEMGSCPGGDC